MQLRSHPNAHQNVILCFMGCALCLFLQVKERNTEGYLHETYPGVKKLIYLPVLLPFWWNISKWRKACPDTPITIFYSTDI
jgi:hypothetical protein